MDSRRVNTVDALGMLEHRRSVHVSWLSIGAPSSGAVSLGSFLLTGSIWTQALVTTCMAVAWVGGLIEGNRQTRSLPAAVSTRATHGAQYRLADAGSLRSESCSNLGQRRSANYRR
jgi:hypothetical protein